MARIIWNISSLLAHITALCLVMNSEKKLSNTETGHTINLLNSPVKVRQTLLCLPIRSSQASVGNARTDEGRCCYNYPRYVGASFKSGLLVYRMPQTETCARLSEKGPGASLLGIQGFSKKRVLLGRVCLMGTEMLPHVGSLREHRQVALYTFHRISSGGYRWWTSLRATRLPQRQQT